MTKEMKIFGNPGFFHGGKFFLVRGEFVRIQSTRLRINRGTWSSQKMMTDTMVRFPGHETVTAEHVWELGEEFLDLGAER